MQTHALLTITCRNIIIRVLLFQGHESFDLIKSEMYSGSNHEALRDPTKLLTTLAGGGTLMNTHLLLSLSMSEISELTNVGSWMGSDQMGPPIRYPLPVSGHLQSVKSEL